MPVRIELGSNGTDFNKIWYLNIFRKSAGKIQASLKYDRSDCTNGTTVLAVLTVLWY
jgi:hypothetical protein